MRFKTKLFLYNVIDTLVVLAWMGVALGAIAYVTITILG